MQGLSELLAGGQIPGGRDYQEDAFQITRFRQADSEGLLLVLADGMGGHIGGARASELAVATFVARFERADGEPGERLRESLEAANAAIGEDAASDPRYAEMGCTLLACLVSDDRLHWVSVGDSPLWRLGADGMTRLNADHSMRPVLEDLVELGRMTPEELEADPRVNQLRSALIGEDLPMVDQNEQPLALAADDRIILASDGLESLSVQEIGELVQGHAAPADAVAALLDAIEALGRPGQDNTTVVVYRHTESGSVGRCVEQMEATTEKRSPATTASQAPAVDAGEPDKHEEQESAAPQDQPVEGESVSAAAHKKGLFSRLFGRKS